MSTSGGALRWLLFLTLFWVWPIPLFGLEGSTVPLARFLQLALSLLVLIVLEGAGGMVGVFFGLLAAHVVVYGLVLFIVSSLVVRQVLTRLPRPLGTGLALAIALALLAWGSFGHPYDSVFHHSEAHASLLELYR